MELEQDVEQQEMPEPETQRGWLLSKLFDNRISMRRYALRAGLISFLPSVMIAVILGSIIAVLGEICGLIKDSLIPLSGSEITAADVTSDPVPAVVGIATSGWLVLFIRSTDLKCMRSISLSVILILAAFAVSIADPPPMARNESQPLS